MGRAPYSADLRALVVEEVAGGASRRAAGRRYKVSPSSAIRWVERHERTGSLAPRRRSTSRSPLEAHADWLLDLIAREPDRTLAAIVARLASERGVATSDSSVDRFFKRRNISFKKSLRAAEQERPDVAAARQAWKAGQASFDPRKLVFIDETGANTKMVRSHGRSPRGRRLLSKAPWGHWKTTTFTAGLRHDGITAPFVLDGAQSAVAQGRRAHLRGSAAAHRAAPRRLQPRRVRRLFRPRRLCAGLSGKCCCGSMVGDAGARPEFAAGA